MIRKFVLRMLALSVAAGLAFLLLDQARRVLTPPAASAVIVDRLRSTRELIGLIVEVAEPRTTIKSGKLGGIEVVLLVRGQAHLGVDLSLMRIESVDETTHTLIVTLPPPTVRIAKVDPQQTLFLRHQRYGLWTLVQVEKVDREVVATALADAQNVVHTTGADPRHQPAAKRVIEQALTDIATQAKWTIHVHWQPQPQGSQ